MNTSNYAITKVYDDLTCVGERVRWNNIVWSRIATPRSRFIAWLAFNNRLKTKQRLKLAGKVENDSYPMCGLESETVNHLFFNCTFSKVCVDALKVYMGITGNMENLMDTLRGNRLARTKKKYYEAILCNLIYAI